MVDLDTEDYVLVGREGYEEGEDAGTPQRVSGSAEQAHGTTLDAQVNEQTEVQLF